MRMRGPRGPEPPTCWHLEAPVWPREKSVSSKGRGSRRETAGGKRGGRGPGHVPGHYRHWETIRADATRAGEYREGRGNPRTQPGQVSVSSLTVSAPQCSDQYTDRRFIGGRGTDCEQHRPDQLDSKPAAEERCEEACGAASPRPDPPTPGAQMSPPQLFKATRVPPRGRGTGDARSTGGRAVSGGLLHPGRGPQCECDHVCANSSTYWAREGLRRLGRTPPMQGGMETSPALRSKYKIQS